MKWQQGALSSYIRFTRREQKVRKRVTDRRLTTYVKMLQITATMLSRTIMKKRDTAVQCWRKLVRMAQMAQMSRDTLAICDHAPVPSSR